MIFFDHIVAKEASKANIRFCPAFIAAEAEASKHCGRATMQWSAAMPDGQTVEMAIVYPTGVGGKTQADYRASIIKQLRVRFPMAKPLSVNVGVLLYEARPGMRNKLAP